MMDRLAKRFPVDMVCGLVGGTGCTGGGGDGFDGELIQGGFTFTHFNPFLWRGTVTDHR